MASFAITGVAGLVAARHLRAIAALGHRVVAAYDPRDAAGVLDEFNLTTPFFTDAERFEQRLRDLRSGSVAGGLDVISVCSPNDVHRATCELGLDLGVDVLCEKPVVIDPRELDTLQAHEERTGRRVWTVLQLRTIDRLVALRDEVRRRTSVKPLDVQLTYVTARGPWYDLSWKGAATRSGGLAVNIGVHVFDLLLWIFGAVKQSSVHLRENRRIAGQLELEDAHVSWFLSVEPVDLPRELRESGRRTYRSLLVDGAVTEFSTGFADLHGEVYRRTLAGDGFSLDDARPSIELAHQIRHARVERAGPERQHPLVEGQP